MRIGGFTFGKRNNNPAFQDSAVQQYQLDRLPARTIELVQVLCHFSQDPIPLVLVDSALPGFSRGRDTLSPDVLKREFGVLVDRSIAIHGRDSFTLQPDVIKTVISSMSQTDSAASKARAISWLDAAFASRQGPGTTGLEQLVPHALAVAQSASGDSQLTAAANMLYEGGSRLFDSNRLASAEMLMIRSISMYEQTLGPLHPDLAGILNIVGWMLTQSGKPADGEPLLRTAVAIYENQFGPTFSELTPLLNNLGLTLMDTGNFDDADLVMRRALSVERTGKPPNEQYVARHLGNIAVLLTKQERLTEAEQYISEALDIQLRSKADALDIAMNYGRLAEIMLRTDRAAAAETAIRRSLKITSEAYGDDHVEVAGDLKSLGRVLLELKRLNEAESPLRQALKIYEREYGTGHANTAECLASLACVLKELGQFDEAVVFMRRALVSITAVEAISKLRHEHTASFMGMYLRMLAASGRSAEEIKVELEAVGAAPVDPGELESIQVDAAFYMPLPQDGSQH